MSAVIEYRGFTLQFDEYDETWRVSDDGGDLSAKSVKALKGMIDNQLKKKFEPFDAYYKPRWSSHGKVRPCKVTSMVRGSFSVWIAYQDITGRHQRTKTEQAAIMQKTPEADKAYEEIESLEMVVKECERDIEKLVKAFKPYWKKGEMPR